MGRLAEAGLEARIDGIGTVFGRSRGKGRALLIGSHTDTQPTGGWLDGAMGVIYGLEIARALRESPDDRDFAVDVASWIDEEGTYAGFIGSRSFCGEPVAEIVARARNRDGQRMSDALRAAEIAGAPLARMEVDRYVAYLEPHIEQGGRLEAAGKRIGVVTCIVGIVELRITFRGQQNHAGTTPMEVRRDAGAALIRFAGTIDRRVPSRSPDHRPFGTSAASSSVRAHPASFPARPRWSCKFAIPRRRAVSTSWRLR